MKQANMRVFIGNLSGDILSELDVEPAARVRELHRHVQALGRGRQVKLIHAGHMVVSMLCRCKELQGEGLCAGDQGTGGHLASARSHQHMGEVYWGEGPGDHCVPWSWRRPSRERKQNGNRHIATLGTKEPKWLPNKRPNPPASPRAVITPRKREYD